MPIEHNNPNAPPTGQPPETTAAQTTENGTLLQDALPSWVKDDAPPSSDSRSGRAISALEHEITSNQAAGVDIAEGYSLIRKLGTGSFGAVWEAENRLTRERVAIKFFTASDEVWASLLGEVGLLQSVEGCRGIVLVKEVRQGGPNCRPHYVMQLANQGSLAEWLKKAHELPPSERLKLAVGFFTRVARAMAAVHRRGIHHCDLKPQNILLHGPEPDSPPEPLVADFGQAHFATDDTPALGTFFYMPPDQIDATTAGTPSDTRWDVYALGAVVYEMLTGEPPRRTPELVDRIKKAPKQLGAKMSIYREGILAAPKPDAHRKIADPMLAKIIDRCLALRPDKRPADAGALVALLDARARWRRTRPVLALAAVATLLVIALVTAAGILTAKKVTTDSEKNVTDELNGSLARTAGYSVPAVERRLQRQVVTLEKTADKPPESARAVLNKISRQQHGSQFDPKSLSPNERTQCNNWLRTIIDERKKNAINNDTATSVSLVVVTDSETPGLSRGFFLSRAHADGIVEDGTSTGTPEVYSRDFSYRDYFHGLGNLQNEAGQPHVPIYATHISDPYHSKGEDHTIAGDHLLKPWKVNVVTPIWEEDRVIGLLIFGMNLERDVLPLLEPANLGAKGSEQLGISLKVKVVLIDHRNHWVWHPDCRDWLAEDRSNLPHDYQQLASKREQEPIKMLPWLGMKEPEAGKPYGYKEAAEYVDLVEAEPDNAKQNTDPEIACFTSFHPYAKSKYGGLHSRQWILVAQVDRKTALRPLDDLHEKIVLVGEGVGLVLVLIAVGLWIGLVTVLRRLEFASHG